ncbi:Maestro heat-like repeat-containing protein family member 2A, partial [Nestor notabilis]
VKTAASDVLVPLARSRVHFVMSELQSHLRATAKVPDETVLLTVARMARSYALRCIPFVGMTMRTMLGQVGSGRILCAICSVVEEWSKGVNTYLCNQDECPFSRKGVAQFCGAIHPIFHYATVNWLGFKEKEDNQAVLGAVAAMAEVLLHEEQHRECSWELVLWLLHQHQEVPDTSVVTKSLSYVLEMLEGLQTPLTQDMALTISAAVHGQLSRVTKESGLAHKAVLSRCTMLQARIWPEETVTFLHSQLSAGSEAGRMAALGLLVALCHSHALVTTQKLIQLVKDVKLMCKARAWVPGEVTMAVLEFIRELLSTGSQGCWTWDMVRYIFTEFSQTSGRLVR